MSTSKCCIAIWSWCWPPIVATWDCPLLRLTLGEHQRIVAPVNLRLEIYKSAWDRTKSSQHQIKSKYHGMQLKTKLCAVQFNMFHVQSTDKRQIWNVRCIVMLVPALGTLTLGNPRKVVPVISDIPSSKHGKTQVLKFDAFDLLWAGCSTLHLSVQLWVYRYVRRCTYRRRYTDLHIIGSASGSKELKATWVNLQNPQS